MKLYVEETIGNVVEVESLTTILEIADFDAGLRQMLEAEQSDTISAGGDITLTDDDKVIQFINPNGASRNVYLPAVSINNHGFLIINTAASSYTLTVLSGATTLGVIQADSGIGWFVSNGIIWKKAGGGSSTVVIQEVDGSPSSTVGTIKFPNGVVTDNGGGIVSIFGNGIYPSNKYYDLIEFTWSADKVYASASMWMYGYWRQDTPANGDTFSISIPLLAGTYTMERVGSTANTRGKIDVSVDGNNIVSAEDWYSSSAVIGVIKTTTGIVIPNTGLHTILITINGHNASTSSPHYYVSLNGIVLRKTA